MSQRRTKLEIKIDILDLLVEKERKPTSLMFKSNLSHLLINEYVDLLQQKELIKITHEPGKRSNHRIIRITEKGKRILIKAKRLLGQLEGLL